MTYFLDMYWPNEPALSGRDENALWFHRGKENRAKKIKVGDRVLLYETRAHPDHTYLKGSKKVFASATVIGSLIEVDDNSLVGRRAWKLKIPLEFNVKLDRKDGIDWKTACRLLGWKDGARFRQGPLKISKSIFFDFENLLLEKLVGDFDERNEIVDEIIEHEELFAEGKRTMRTHMTIERNRNIIRKLKQNMFKQYGKLFCQICNFSFEDSFGEIGRNIIDIHHIKPLSQLSGEIQVSISDLIPICPNCHRLIHSKRPSMSINEILNIVHNK